LRYRPTAAWIGLILTTKGVPRDIVSRIGGISNSTYLVLPVVYTKWDVIGLTSRYRVIATCTIALVVLLAIVQQIIWAGVEHITIVRHGIGQCLVGATREPVIDGSNGVF